MKNYNTKKKNNVIQYLDWILLALILIFVIYAQIDGRFIHNTTTIIEICNGIPKTPLLNITP